MGRSWSRSPSYKQPNGYRQFRSNRYQLATHPIECASAHRVLEPRQRRLRCQNAHPKPGLCRAAACGPGLPGSRPHCRGVRSPRRRSCARSSAGTSTSVLSVPESAHVTATGFPRWGDKHRDPDAAQRGPTSARCTTATNRSACDPRSTPRRRNLRGRERPVPAPPRSVPAPQPDARATSIDLFLSSRHGRSSRRRLTDRADIRPCTQNQRNNPN